MYKLHHANWSKLNNQVVIMVIMQARMILTPTFIFFL